MLSIADEPLLTDVFPPTSAHNIGARLLRLGLAVSSFSSLEKYVAGRFADLTTSIEASPIPFSTFRVELQAFLSREAATGLLNRMSFMEDGQRQVFFDGELRRLSGYLGSPVKYSAFGFSPKGSNVGHEDVKQAFAAFGVKDAWGKIKDIASAVGSSRLSLNDDFKNMAKTRHASAHNPDSNIPTSDLKTHIEVAILLGIAIDALCGVVGQAYKTASTSTDAVSLLVYPSFMFKFIDEETSGSFVERSQSSSRVIKRYNSEVAAVAGAKARSSTSLLVVRNVSKVPVALI